MYIIKNTEPKPSYPPVPMAPTNAVVNSWFKLQKTPGTVQEEIVF